MPLLHPQLLLARRRACDSLRPTDERQKFKLPPSPTHKLHNKDTISSPKNRPRSAWAGTWQRKIGSRRLGPTRPLTLSRSNKRRPPFSLPSRTSPTAPGHTQPIARTTHICAWPCATRLTSTTIHHHRRGHSPHEQRWGGYTYTLLSPTLPLTKDDGAILDLDHRLRLDITALGLTLKPPDLRTTLTPVMVSTTKSSSIERFIRHANVPATAAVYQYAPYHDVRFRLSDLLL